ncbi:hypothetical protein ACOSP7_027769 [Xanthoceras sorbifolium]
MESSSNRRLPPGFRFDPTDQQLIIDYLFNKVHGNPLPSSIAVIDCDIYGDGRLWRRLFEESEADTLYFFTRIKKKTSKGKRVDRVTGSGTWKGQSHKKIYFRDGHQNVSIVGSKGCFSFQPKKGFQERCGKWVMHEYMLDGCLLDQNNNNNNCYVLCRIKNKKGKKDRKTDTYGPTDDDVQVIYSNRIHYGMEPQSIVEAAGLNYGGTGMSNMVQGILHGSVYVDSSTREHQLSSFHNMEVEDAERRMVQGLHGCVYDVNSDTDTSGHHQLTSDDNYVEDTTRSMVQGLHVCVYEVNSSSEHHRLNSPDNDMEDEQCHNLERVGLGAAAGVPQQASVYIGDDSSDWTMEELEKFLDG